MNAVKMMRQLADGVELWLYKGGVPERHGYVYMGAGPAGLTKAEEMKNKPWAYSTSKLYEAQETYSDYYYLVFKPGKKANEWGEVAP